MPRGLQVREALDTDATAIAAVHIRSWQDAYADRWRQRDAPSLEHRVATWRYRIEHRADGEYLLVAILDDDVAGFTWAGPTSDPDDKRAVGEIRSIHVDPGKQGRGVGQTLINEVTRRLSVSHVDLTLWVVDDNTSARAFYERLGWRTDGTQRRQRLAMPGEDGPMVTVVRYRTTSTAKPTKGVTCRT